MREPKLPLLRLSTFSERNPHLPLFEFTNTEAAGDQGNKNEPLRHPWREAV